MKERENDKERARTVKGMAQKEPGMNGKVREGAEKRKEEQEHQTKRVVEKVVKKVEIGDQK